MPTPLADNLNEIQGDPALQRALAATMPVVRTVIAPTWVPVAASTTAEQALTVPGVALLDFVHVSRPSIQAGLSIGGCRVSAVNTVQVTWINASAGALTPTAAESLRVFHARATV